MDTHNSQDDIEAMFSQSGAFYDNDIDMARPKLADDDLLNYMNFDGGEGGRIPDQLMDSSSKMDYLNIPPAPEDVPMNDAPQVPQQPSQVNGFRVVPKKLGGTNSPKDFMQAYNSNKSAQEKLSSFSFGKQYSALDTPAVPEPTVSTEGVYRLLESPDHQISPRKYQLKIGELPSKSRVETQIRCRLVISPPPDAQLIHLPSNTIARPKFQLKDPFTPQPGILHLDVDVISSTEPDKKIMICQRCMNREEKRASRKKNIDFNEKEHWSVERQRKLAIFNCREVLLMSLTKECNINNETLRAKEIELPMRLACYGRHHNATQGFRVIFTLRDETNEVVAQAMSSPILITDDHKDPKMQPMATPAKPGNNENDIKTEQVDQKGSLFPHPPSTAPGSMFSWPGSEMPSPASMEESSEAMNSDYSASGGLKRRRENDWNTPAGPSRSQVPSFQLNRNNSSTSPPNLATPLLTNRPEMPSPQSSDGMSRASAVNPLVQNGGMTSPMSGFGRPPPQIKRIIPAQGPVRGGVEITLLGDNFEEGMIAVFGGNPATQTQFWSASTIVVRLPPATSPGPVVVTFQGYNILNNPQIFTYYDDTDRQLIELALQVIGMKMNGKLEDARNIAMRIVHQGNADERNGSASGGSAGNGPVNGNTINKVNHEFVVLRCIELVHVNDQGKLPNWQLRNSEGQTMLHLAAALGYTKVLVALIAEGAKLDCVDFNGMAPLHYAAFHGHAKFIQKLLRGHANPFVKDLSGRVPRDLAQAHVVDLLPEAEDAKFSRSMRNSSSSTLDSIISDEDDYRYVSRSGIKRDRSSTSVSRLLYDDEYDSDGNSGWSEDGEFDYEDDEEVESLNPNEAPRSPSTAQNISKYIKRVSSNARNKMHWDIVSWDDVLNYIYRKHDVRRRPKLDEQGEVVVVGERSQSPSSSPQSGNESDSTITSQPNNIKRMWKYFMPQIQEDRESSAPPRYDELYPEAAASSSRHVHSSVDAVAAAAAAAAVVDDDDDKMAAVLSSSDSEENVEEQFIANWDRTRKQLQNDRMLFLFWIPAFLIVLFITLAKYTDKLPWLTGQVDYMGTKIRDLITFCFIGRVFDEERAVTVLSHGVCPVPTATVSPSVLALPSC
ncbi:hypothetical protein TRVA0_001S04698 [Trichomonascus vanleenenianus]|uniref:uncharacterized protein n=1 Tax=Trichomonascus vanleenenianus TaxID=2268995 RepID=UPI003ECA46E1